MEDIPQELVNHITSFLKNDKTALRNAMLVNYRLNHSSTTQFFRTLDLTIRPASSSNTHSSPPQRHLRFQMLLDLMQSNSRISNAVQTVDLGDLDRLSDDERQLTYPTLCAILDGLPRISTLTLRSICIPRLPSRLRNAIFQKLTSSTLDSLDVWNCQFSNVDDFFRFLNDHSTIRTLRVAVLQEAPLAAGEPSLVHVGIQDGVTVRRNPGRKLESLTIDKDSPISIVDALSPLTTTPKALDLMYIKHLALNGIQDFPAANSLLRIIGGSLESLEISCSALQLTSLLADAEPPLLDLHFNVNLVNLRISSLQWTGTLCPAHRICSLFRNVVTLSKLADIQLVLTAWIRRTSTSLAYDQWADLDDLFSGSSFPSLQSVGVIIHGNNLPLKFRPNPSELVAYFPRLTLAHKISVRWHDDSDDKS